MLTYYVGAKSLPLIFALRWVSALFERLKSGSRMSADANTSRACANVLDPQIVTTFQLSLLSVQSTWPQECVNSFCLCWWFSICPKIIEWFVSSFIVLEVVRWLVVGPHPRSPSLICAQEMLAWSSSECGWGPTLQLDLGLCWFQVDHVRVCLFTYKGFLAQLFLIVRKFVFNYFLFFHLAYLNWPLAP